MDDHPPSVRFVNPSTMARPNGYSQVAEVTGGRLVFVAGQVAFDAAGRVVGAGDFRTQAREAFRNVQRALAAVGLGPEHVVKLQMFVTDFAHLAALRAVRDEFVNTAAPPPSTTVQVVALFHPDLLFEVDAVAVAPIGDAGGPPFRGRAGAPA